jgi:hypothetical protein
MASEPEVVADVLEQYRNVVSTDLVGDEIAVEYSGSHRIAVFSEAAQHGYVADSLSILDGDDAAEVYFVKASHTDLRPTVETEVSF